MTHINIKISKAVAVAEKDGILTSGMVGVPSALRLTAGGTALLSRLFSAAAGW